MQGIASSSCICLKLSFFFFFFLFPLVLTSLSEAANQKQSTNALPFLKPDDTRVLYIYEGETFRGKEIEGEAVVDLLSHHMGTTPFHPQTDRSLFPSSDLFSKPRAAVSIILPAVNIDDIKKQFNLKVLGQDSIIVNHASLVLYPFVAEVRDRGVKANYAHMMSELFSGKSMTLSLSADSQVAVSLSAVNLNTINPSWNNDAYSWNPQEAYVDSLMGRLPSEWMVSKTNLVNGKLLSTDMQKIFGPENKHLSVEYHPQSKMLTVEATDSHTRTSQTNFDLSQKEDLEFIVEVEMALRLGFVHNNNYLAKLVNDPVPDFYSIAFSSLIPLQNKYFNNKNDGLDKYTAALLIVDALVDELITSLQKMYDDNLLVQILIVHPSIFTNTFNLANNQPGSIKSSVVDKRELDLTSSPTSSSLSPSTSVSVTPSTSLSPSTSPTPSTSPSPSPSLSPISSPNFTADDVANFQIILWMLIFLLFMTLLIVYSLCYMNAGTDSLLYRTTHHPKQQ